MSEAKMVYDDEMKASVVPILMSAPYRLRGFRCADCGSLTLQVMDEEGEVTQYRQESLDGCPGRLVRITLDEIRKILAIVVH